MEDYGLSHVKFEQALCNAIGATWMRDQIISEVLTTADQFIGQQSSAVGP